MRLGEKITFIIYVMILTAQRVIGTQPTFGSMLSSISVWEGEETILPCIVENLGSYKVAWTDNNNSPISIGKIKLIEDPRIMIEQYQNRLWNIRIVRVRQNDAGNYNCVISVTPQIRKTIHLNVNVFARIVDTRMTPEEVHEGSKVKLECNVVGQPPPVIKWYKMDSSNDKSIDTGIRGPMLKVENVTSRDWSYKCVADNGSWKSVEKSFSINVIFGPNVRIRTIDTVGRLKEKAVLKCTVASNPRSSIYWLLQGREVINDLTHRILLEDDKSNTHSSVLTLTILYLKPEDLGLYHCVAENKHKSVTVSVRIYQMTSTTSLYSSSIQVVSSAFFIEILLASFLEILFR